MNLIKLELIIFFSCSNLPLKLFVSSFAKQIFSKIFTLMKILLKFLLKEKRLSYPPKAKK